jgi:hypothetical protein
MAKPMVIRRPPQNAPSELLQVVLDDSTVDQLRRAAADRGIEVEELIVQVLFLVSSSPDQLLGSPAR